MKAKKSVFTMFVTRALKSENTHVLLGELLQYFEKQLNAKVVCE